MLVSHAPAAHRELDGLLRALRGSRTTGKPLVVDASWLLLEPAEPAGLFRAGEPGGARHSTGPRWPSCPPRPSWRTPGSGAGPATPSNRCPGGRSAPSLM
jgi:hypothetical protein